MYDMIVDIKQYKLQRDFRGVISHWKHMPLKTNTAQKQHNTVQYSHTSKCILDTH
jgi:hypothetical protein